MNFSAFGSDPNFVLNDARQCAVNICLLCVLQSYLPQLSSFTFTITFFLKYTTSTFS